jgi:hypothetical protein
LSFFNNQNLSIFRSEDIHSPNPTDFLLADIHTSNPFTPLSSMTSPSSPDDHKRKRDDDNYEIEELLYFLIDSIHNHITSSSNKLIKRQKT